MKHSKIILYVAFAFIIAGNAAFWMQSKLIQPAWGNVPPAPTALQSSASSLGDAQLSYRRNAVMLTNLGNTGGDIQRFENYNYEALKNWFELSDDLDPQARAIPHLATYYYGSVKDADKLLKILPYIERVGSAPYPNRWPFMMQAIYLAKHEIKDLSLALSLAEKLAALPYSDIPEWTQQLRAFVLIDQGNKEAAYDIMKQILLGGIDTLPREEIYNMRIIICERILTPEEAKQDAICQS